MGAMILRAHADGTSVCKHYATMEQAQAALAQVIRISVERYNGKSKEIPGGVAIWGTSGMTDGVYSIADNAEYAKPSFAVTRGNEFNGIGQSNVAERNAALRTHYGRPQVGLVNGPDGKWFVKNNPGSSRGVLAHTDASSVCPACYGAKVLKTSIPGVTLKCRKCQK
jgi:hypothetical protein